ncbi:hypothetical protein A4S06_05200 [Erysipelotrichaceae bacterium MTC7]|nr:hypothetical protein A4S06_05200 [Erysipelotrichaceae bacterium MTC7]
MTALNKFDMELYKQLGKVLKERRIEKDISLDRLSEAIGGVKTKSTLKRYEDGKSRVDMDTLELICKALDLDIDELLSKGMFYFDFNDKENDDYKSFSDIIKPSNPTTEYLEKNNPELLEIYNSIRENDNLVLLFDKTKDLSPEDMERILTVIKGIRAERGMD